MALYVNSLAKNNKQKAFDGVTVSGCNYYEDIDGIGFSVLFDSTDVQQRFFGAGNSEEKQSGQKKETSGFFVKKTSIKTEFPISSTKVAGDLKMVSLLAISSWSRENGIDEEKKNLIVYRLSNSVFIYDFATPQNGLKSEKMYSENGFFHNVFIKSAQEIEGDNTIVFYVETVDRGLIYICLVFVVVLGVTTAYFITKRKKKSV